MKKKFKKKKDDKLDLPSTFIPVSNLTLSVTLIIRGCLKRMNQT